MNEQYAGPESNRAKGRSRSGQGRATDGTGRPLPLIDLIDTFLNKVEEPVDPSHGKVRAYRVGAQLVRVGYAVR